MKPLRNPLFFILMILCFAGFMSFCVKKKIPPLPRKIEIMYPSSYLMVYPKSWWKYKEVKTNNIDISKVNDNYVLDSTTTTPDYYSVKTYELKWIPLCRMGAIWGNKRHNGIQRAYSHRFEWSPLVDSSIAKGIAWDLEYDHYTGATDRAFKIAQDTSIKINNTLYKHVMIVRYYRDVHGIIIVSSDKYYSWGVGQILMKYYPTNRLNNFPLKSNIPADSAVAIWELQEYHINK